MRVSITADHVTFPFKAPNCFLHVPRGAEEAALMCWRTFLHPEGDHFTLINIYKAFQDTALYSASDRE